MSTAFKTFIRGTDTYSTCKNPVPAPILRKSFVLDFVPSTAILKICVAGFYELYINGRNITKGRLAPFISNPDHILYYDEYEISKLLQQGKNAVAVVLGNGFANQDYARINFNTSPFRAPLVLGLLLSLTDGSRELIIESDESFKTHPSPVLFDMYRFGVIYDARREVEGFSRPDFDDSGWKNAEIAASPKGVIKKSTALPVKDQYELKPQSIEKQNNFYYIYDADNKPVEKTRVDSGWCYDFGYCRAGVCRLKISGRRGQKITLRHGEEARRGSFSLNSVISYRAETDSEYIHLFQADTYILKGGEEEIFVPPFTYHGFRYVLVEGITEEQASRDLLTFVVFNTDIKKRSDFHCSDETINTLYNMAIHSDLSNLHHIPTDCPSREKNGWTGDMNVSACQFLLSFDCSENLRMWLECIRFTQTDEGMLPGVVPTNNWGYTWGNGPVWDCVIINVPYYAYKFTGRLDLFNENSDMIFKYLKFIANKRDERGLVEFGLGDWCQPYRPNSKSDSPLVFASGSQIYEASLRAAFLFGLTGKEAEREFALQLAAEIRQAIRSHLIDLDSCIVVGNCQTSQSVALKTGLFDPDEYGKAYQKLREIIKRDNYTICCGMYGLRNIFHVLSDNGDADIALAMITKKDSPSYRNMIDLGGTALFESLIPNGINESRNHHFFGDIINLFISKIAGLRINPDMNDPSEVLINPCIPKSLSCAQAEYCFGSGRTVRVHWKKENGAVKICVTLPECSHGKIKIKDTLVPLKPGTNNFTL